MAESNIDNTNRARRLRSNYKIPFTESFSQTFKDIGLESSHVVKDQSSTIKKPRNYEKSNLTAAEISEKRRANCIKYLGPYNQMGEVDEDGLNDKEAIQRFHSVGYYVTDPPSDTDILQLDKDAKSIINKMTRVKNKEYVFTRIIEELNEDGERIAVDNKDRQIMDVGDCSESDGWKNIPKCFKPSFLKGLKLLHKIADSFGEPIWDLSAVQCSTILSLEQSSMQQCHFDYAGDWPSFDAAVEKFGGMTPLSMLNFPQGLYKC